MFTIQTVKNLQWANAEHTQFECLVKYEEFNEEHPTGVCASDRYEHIQALWTKALNGEYGEIAEYVPPEVPPIPEIPVTITENISTEENNSQVTE